MISPHTSPGTKVVCIDDGLHYRYSAPHNVGAGGLDGLTKGQVYTVESVERDTYIKNGFAVVLVEIRRKYELNDSGQGFALERFRYVDLPKILRELEAGGRPDPDAWEELKRKKTRTNPKETVAAAGTDDFTFMRLLQLALDAESSRHTDATGKHHSKYSRWLQCHRSCRALSKGHSLGLYQAARTTASST